MLELKQLRAMRQLGKLHHLRVEEAQGETARAQANLEQALLATEESAANRDEAQNYWLAGLDAGRPDPRHIAITRNWLIAREADLKSSRIDEAIAQAGRDDAAAVLAQRQALRDTCDNRSRKLRRRVDRLGEERRLAEIADVHLRRRFA